ncbi:hypothetical protein ACJ73_06833 [Blastomyces percursus]|uniref:Uncharacterized protein n=1 Tax=Blastomyces percursus TaxID=1658174 RepID=A0A1J9R022_9EURO|nr:hypothetical protein ACJ73_06833 [Blastomyces percursus]
MWKHHLSLAAVTRSAEKHAAIIAEIWKDSTGRYDSVRHLITPYDRVKGEEVLASVSARRYNEICGALHSAAIEDWESAIEPWLQAFRTEYNRQAQSTADEAAVLDTIDDLEHLEVQLNEREAQLDERENRLAEQEDQLAERTTILQRRVDRFQDRLQRLGEGKAHLAGAWTNFRTEEAASPARKQELDHEPEEDPPIESTRQLDALLEKGFDPPPRITPVEQGFEPAPRAQTTSRAATTIRGLRSRGGRGGYSERMTLRPDRTQEVDSRRFTYDMDGNRVRRDELASWYNAPVPAVTERITERPSSIRESIREAHLNDENGGSPWEDPVLPTYGSNGGSVNRYRDRPDEHSTRLRAADIMLFDPEETDVMAFVSRLEFMAT